MSGDAARRSACATSTQIGVAVSGGADSVCLLHLLLESNRNLTVVHVNHKLRGAESDADAVFVCDLAAKLQLPFELREIRTAAARDNLEQAARKARYAFFRELIASGAVDSIALGHTLSDQAETVLFRFLRGSGTAGLSGIRPSTSDGFIRPLLGVARKEVEAWLRERNIPWREDSSNADVAFARNRIRHQLLPQLTRDWNPALPETLAQVAEWAQGEEEYWAAEIDRIAARQLLHRPPAVVLNAAALNGFPVAVGRRLIRRAIEIAKGDLRSVDFSHVERIRAMAFTIERGGRVQIPGLDVRRSFEWIRLAPPRANNADFEYAASVPGRITLPGAGSVIDLKLEAAESIYNEAVNCLDWVGLGDYPSGSLAVRNWRPGDRYRRVGHAGEEKIKQLFQESRIPVWLRRSWPVLTFRNRIVWSRQFGPGADFAATPATRTVLVIGESWNRDLPA
ncbi:MAG: tRNA lysidine(34) synthetase TilS [Acidobacteriota bacterium]|nr:tRNA lysidine(34) synthetase TilS [Acidobacteriota bacterium]